MFASELLRAEDIRLAGAMAVRRARSVLLLHGGLHSDRSRARSWSSGLERSCVLVVDALADVVAVAISVNKTAATWGGRTVGGSVHEAARQAVRAAAGSHGCLGLRSTLLIGVVLRDIAKRAAVSKTAVERAVKLRTTLLRNTLLRAGLLQTTLLRAIVCPADNVVRESVHAG